MLDNIVQAWCDLNDPKKSMLLQDNRNLKVSTLFSESIKPAVNTAEIIGNPNYKAQEAALKKIVNGREPSALNEKEFAEALKEFQKNPLVGCTTILDMARIASGYDTNGKVNDKANEEAFNDFIRRVLKAPFFHLNMDEYSEYHRREKSWERAISEISDLYDDVQEEDKAKIRQSIKNLANAVASNENTRQSNNLFSVSTINNPQDTKRIDVYLYISRIQMQASSSKGSDCKQTDINIRKINLTFNKEIWSQYARSVLLKHIELVENWLEDNSMKPGNKTTSLCIGPYQTV